MTACGVFRQAAGKVHRPRQLGFFSRRKSRHKCITNQDAPSSSEHRASIRKCIAWHWQGVKATAVEEFAGHLDAHGEFAGEHGLGALAVALVCRRIGLGRAGGVTQVVAQLGALARSMRVVLNAIEAALTAALVIGPVTNWSIS